MARSVHRYHPDPKRDDDPEAILWDDCEACLENAADPRKRMDGHSNAALQMRLVGVVNTNDEFRSHAEVFACRALYEEVESQFGPTTKPWPHDAVRRTMRLV